MIAKDKPICCSTEEILINEVELPPIISCKGVLSKYELYFIGTNQRKCDI